MQPGKKHVGDVRLRFHNVRGMHDHRFRQYYLGQARRACDVLVLAETGCHTGTLETEWAADWKQSGGEFWASTPARVPPARGHSGRGMAILLAQGVAKDARLLAKDAGGRFIAVALTISDTRMVVVGVHAEKPIDAIAGTVDQQRAALFERVRSEVPLLPGYEYIFAMDANNVVDDSMDFWHYQGGSNEAVFPLAIAAMEDTLAHFGAACDVFRS